MLHNNPLPEQGKFFHHIRPVAISSYGGTTSGGHYLLRLFYLDIFGI